VTLGLISDIHGNATALAAVIDDARRLGVERWWVLGDIVALGPDPVGVLRTLEGLPNVDVIGGNTERYVISGDRPFPGVDDVRSDPDLLERLVEVEASFSWTRGAITAAGYFDYLASLRSELRFTLPDGTRVLGVHASPHSDDGQGIDTVISDVDLSDLLEGCGADLVFADHTHDATDRVVDGVRAVNLGSLSNPNRADRCATYCALMWDSDRHEVHHRIVDYDHRAELEALDLVRHPASGYLRRFHL
jgi:predicted phosphodiesterase